MSALCRNRHCHPTATSTFFSEFSHLLTRLTGPTLPIPRHPPRPTRRLRQSRQPRTAAKPSQAHAFRHGVLHRFESPISRVLAPASKLEDFFCWRFFWRSPKRRVLQMSWREEHQAREELRKPLPPVAAMDRSRQTCPSWLWVLDSL